MSEVSFKAPWGMPLKVMTVASCMFCLGIAVWMALGHSSASLRLTEISILFGLVFGSAMFMVRGYRLSDTHLHIRRLGWETRFALSDLISAEVDAQAVRGSWRIFGNGGFFSFSGLFRNTKIGTYRAFLTDARKAVVLRFAKRTIVVSPDDPERFVSEIMPRLAFSGKLG